MVLAGSSLYTGGGFADQKRAGMVEEKISLGI